MTTQAGRNVPKADIDKLGFIKNQFESFLSPDQFREVFGVTEQCIHMFFQSGCSLVFKTQFNHF